MNGDGNLEFLQAIRSDWISRCGGGGPGAAYFASLYSLGQDSALWTIPGRWFPSIWELDGDNLPDILLHGRGITLGVKGATGDTLFSIETDGYLYPAVSGSFRADGIQRGILIRSDTLVMFHLELGADASGDTPLLPNSVELHPIFPNPFNASTSIRYNMLANTHVTVAVYDVLGRRVRVLVREVMSSGNHVVQWDGQTDDGHETGSGVYFIKAESKGYQQTRKIMYLK